MADLLSCKSNVSHSALTDALTCHDKDGVTAICRSPDSMITDVERKKVWCYFLGHHQGAEKNESRGEVPGCHGSSYPNGSEDYGFDLSRDSECSDSEYRDSKYRDPKSRDFKYNDSKSGNLESEGCEPECCEPGNIKPDNETNKDSPGISSRGEPCETPDCGESYENLSLRMENSQKPQEKLLDSDPKKKLAANEDLDFLVLDDLNPHPDEAQVMLDVKRSFTLLSQFHMNGNSSYTTILSGDEVKTMRRKLYFLIVHMLRKYPCLHYYQGYHDIASVVLLVCDSDEDSFRVLESLTLYHLRDFMLRDISLTINHLKLIPMILENAEPQLFEMIQGTSPSYMESEGLYYDYKFTPALSSVLTLFSHDLVSFNHITKLWDFILSYKSVAVSAYFYAAAIVHFKDSIVTALDDVTDVDSSMLHSLISPAKLFGDLTEADLESILLSTSSLISNFPLESSPNSSKTYKVWFEEYNRKSVLSTTSSFKTTSDLTLDSDSLRNILELQEEQSVCETLHDAELFKKALDSAESTLASSEEFEKSSLFSSSSMTSSVTSLANSSIIKKIFASGNDKPSSPQSNIFKFTIFVGFAGILIHFMLRQSGWYFISKLPRFIHNSLGDKSFANGELRHVTNVLGEVCSHMREAFARESIDLGQIGLGTLKRHIYALGNLN